MFTQYQDGALQAVDYQIKLVADSTWCNRECAEQTEKYWPSLGNEYMISYVQIILDQKLILKYFGKCDLLVKIET